MNKLNPPDLLVRDTYLSCLSDIKGSNIIYKNKMSKILPQIVSQSRLYALRAVVPELHLFSCARHGHGSDNIVDDITKDNLINLYGGYFSKSGTSSRSIYDILRASSNSVCPFCSFGNVTTLDHYLPKARYPLFSVVPDNLVPACAECNKGKGSSILTTIEEQPLHPYFSEAKFYNDIWITAYIEHTCPPSVVYIVEPPTNWDKPSKQRVINYFKDFNLGERFSIQAGLNIQSAVTTVETLLPIIGSEGIKDHFKKIADNEPPNSILGTFNRALARDNWFCAGEASE